MNSLIVTSLFPGLLTTTVCAFFRLTWLSGELDLIGDLLLVGIAV